MPMAQAAHSAYHRPNAPTRTARGVEYDLLARITQKLTTTWVRRKEDFPSFATALHDNLRLWSTFAADVADSDNGLPKQLRAQIFYLYRFTEDHSRKVRHDKAGIEVLVEVNTAIMRGLRGEGGRP